MAKFCTNCGKELDENAVLCLNCGVLLDSNQNAISNKEKKEKKKSFPTWAIVLIVVFCTVVLPILAVIGVTATVFSELGTIFEEEFFEESTYQYGRVGDTLENNEYKVTLTDTIVYKSIEGENIDLPKDGKEYLVFFFVIENKSEEIQYISSYDFDGYVDSYAISTADIYNNIEDYEELSANLAPGKRAKGFVAYEVDTNWQEFDIHLSDWLGETELVFSIINEENSSITGA